MKKVLLTATVQSHICQFHKPLVQMLHDNGYEVHIAARNNLAEKNGMILDFADKVFDIPFSRSPINASNIKAYKELKRIIDDDKYDIIHCNTPMGSVITRLAAKNTRKHGTKVFYTAHGFHFYNGAPKKNWLIFYPIEKYMAKYTDKILTINTEDYKLAKNNFNTEVYHIHGVGVNTEKYQILSQDECDAFKKECGYTKDEKILLCVGELLPNKNQAMAIRAVNILKDKFPNIKLIIAGNGSEENNLKSLVNNLNLQNNVEFLGYSLILNKYENICNIAVSCSFREGLPLNIMEAMLAKKPVIATKNRGHNELINNGKTGFIVEPNLSLIHISEPTRPY